MGKKAKEKETFMGKFSTESFLKSSLHLHLSAINSFNDQHYLESGIIYFQLVEITLRLVIHLFATKQEVSRSATESIEEEQRFYQLILFFDLIKPDNGISGRLMDFNKQRNSFMHKLFIRKSADSLEEDLKAFCLEGKDLFDRLSKMVNVVNLEIAKNV
jgi:hypothetical protein